MNIQNLKCFLVTTETLNFTKTGEQLFLSQQGVSRVINSLEKELDVPLFVRSKHALSLTPYGAAFKETASEILKQYDYFLERVEELKEEKKKLLRLIIPTGMQHLFPEESVADFIRANPKVRLQIKEMPDYLCEDTVLKGEADFGFCVQTEKAGLKVFANHSENTRLMISEKNPLSKYDEIALEQLKDEKFVTIATSNVCGYDFIKQCKLLNVNTEVVFQSSDLQLLYKMCRNNIGISFYVGPRDPDFPGVQIVKIKGNPIKWDVSFVGREDRILTQEEYYLINCIRTEWRNMNQDK